MKILFIHGMNQQNFNAITLRKHWLNIFQLGINHSDWADFDINSIEIDIPFYGDLLIRHHQHNFLDLDTLLPRTWHHFPLTLNKPSQQTEKLSEFIPTLAEHITSQLLPLSKKLSLYEALSKNIILKELSILLNHFPALHAKLIHEFLIETYLYLSNEQFISEVHNRILSCLSLHEHYIIAGHSLGSVIAYNLLHIHPEYKVSRLISLGSPLAFRVIQEKILHPVICPAGIEGGDWHNFHSHNDFLTAFPLNCPPFNFIPPIHNQMISTFADRPHEIMGYLQHPAVIHSLLEPILKQ